VTEEKTYTIHRTSKVAAKAKLLTRYLTWLYSFLVFVIAYFQDDLIFNPLTLRFSGVRSKLDKRKMSDGKLPQVKSKLWTSAATALLGMLDRVEKMMPCLV
jgi:hypothetical protein